MDLKVDPEKLYGLARTAATTAEGLAETIDGLSGASRSLQAGWQGEAQLSFVRHAGSADAQGRTVAGDLRRSAERLTRLAEAYHKADVNGARSVLGI